MSEEATLGLLCCVGHRKKRRKCSAKNEFFETFFESFGRALWSSISFILQQLIYQLSLEYRITISLFQLRKSHLDQPFYRKLPIDNGAVFLPFFSSWLGDIALYLENLRKTGKSTVRMMLQTTPKIDICYLYAISI